MSRPRRSIYREYVEAVLVAILFAMFVRTFVFKVTKIPTGSMEQTLQVGDHILVNTFVYGSRDVRSGFRLTPHRNVGRGDIVVFRFPEDPERDFIKRCVGLPGDRVEIRNKLLFINDSEINESEFVYFGDQVVYPRSLAVPPEYRPRDNFGPYEVPADNYFCMGDNRDFSNDSRFWGPVPRDFVKGKAFMVFWSFEPAVSAEPTVDESRLLERLAQLPATLSRRARWDRTLRVVR